MSAALMTFENDEEIKEHVSPSDLERGSNQEVEANLEEERKSVDSRSQSLRSFSHALNNIVYD